MKELEFKKELFSQELLQARRQGHKHWAKALGCAKLRTSRDHSCTSAAIQDGKRVMKALGIVGELPQIQEGCL